MLHIYFVGISDKDCVRPHVYYLMYNRLQKTSHHVKNNSDGTHPSALSAILVPNFFVLLSVIWKARTDENIFVFNCHAILRKSLGMELHNSMIYKNLSISPLNAHVHPHYRQFKIN